MADRSFQRFVILCAIDSGNEKNAPFHHRLRHTGWRIGHVPVGRRSGPLG